MWSNNWIRFGECNEIEGREETKGIRSVNGDDLDDAGFKWK